ncbi:hypothetical protein [Paenibacillus sp. BJ-4]|nr:hypothetical protein [Paenibacillus sp. BJ-4]
MRLAQLAGEYEAVFSLGQIAHLPFNWKRTACGRLPGCWTG